MNRSTLYMLISALTTSAWWGASLYGSKHSILWLPVIILTITQVSIIISETITVFDNEK
jgi:hypothetical protein